MKTRVGQTNFRHRGMLATMLMSTALGMGMLPALPMPQAEAQASQTHSFTIPSQPLGRALRSLADQSGLQIAYETAVAVGNTAPAVNGTMSTEQALTRLLAGSNLRHSFTGANTATIVGRSSAAGGASVSADGTIVLETITVEGASQSPWGQVDGYVATQNASGMRTATPILETPQSVSVVTRDQITDQKPASLSDTLTYTPGVTMQSQSFSRMVDDVMMRGFNVVAGTGGMLRDGMKLQSNVYDGGQEPYGLERVEVLRGASSVLYGQLAPGGVVNAISKRPTDKPLHEINAEYGSYDRKQVSFDLSDALNADGSLRYRLTGLVRDADNWVEQTPDNKVYIAPALTWSPDAATSLTLQASYQHVNTKFASPLLYQDVSTSSIPRDLFLGEPGFDRYVGDIYTVGYDLQHTFENDVKLRHASRYYQSEVKWDYMMANVAPVSSNGTLNRLASQRVEKSYGFTTDTSLEKSFTTGPAEHTMLVGIDYYRRGYDSLRFRGTSYVPLDVNDPVYSGSPAIGPTNRGSDSDGNQLGLYLQDQIRIDNWALVIGGRQDWTDSTSTSYQTGKVTDQDDNKATGRAGLVYLFDNGFAPYVSVSQSFAPQVGADSRTGDALKPNEGLQYEAGIRYQPEGSNLLLSAAIYELTQKNLVSYDATGSAYQLGKVRSRGLELEARAEFGALGIIGAYAYTDSEILDSASSYEIGQSVALVPRNTASLWADYKLDELGLTGLSIGGGLRYVGKTSMPDSIKTLGYEADVPGYMLADAMVRYDFGALGKQYEGLDFTLNARNLFDKQFYTCVSTDGCRYGEPMSVVGTLSYKW